MAEDELEALEAGEDDGMKQHDGLVAAARGPSARRSARLRYSYSESLRLSLSLAAFCFSLLVIRGPTYDNYEKLRALPLCSYYSSSVTVDVVSSTSMSTSSSFFGEEKMPA